MKSKKYLTVKELAQATEISVPLIYHYIKNDLLPKPKFLSREKNENGQRNGGVFTVYDRSIIERIKLIRSKTAQGKLLNEIKDELKTPNEDRKKIMEGMLQDLTLLVKNDQYGSEEFKDKLEIISNVAESPTLHPGVKTDWKVFKLK